MAFPLLPVLGGVAALAGGLGGSSGSSSKTTKRGKRFDSMFDAALSGEQSAAEQARENLASFDPQDAYQKSAEGAFRFVEDDILRGIESLRGSQVGMGRLRSGYATTDEDRLYRDIIGDFGARTAQQGVAVNQQRLQQLGMQNQSRDRFLELLTAGQDQEQARKNAEFGFDDFLAGAGGVIGGVIPFL